MYVLGLIGTMAVMLIPIVIWNWQWVKNSGFLEPFMMVSIFMVVFTFAILSIIDSKMVLQFLRFPTTAFFRGGITGLGISILILGLVWNTDENNEKKN